MSHWASLQWVAYMAAGIVTWRYLPLTVVRLVAAFTRDEQCHRQCMEVLWISGRKAVPPLCCLSCQERAAIPTVRLGKVDATP
jgi:hypothetical protein